MRCVQVVDVNWGDEPVQRGDVAGRVRQVGLDQLVSVAPVPELNGEVEEVEVAVDRCKYSELWNFAFTPTPENRRAEQKRPAPAQQ